MPRPKNRQRTQYCIDSDGEINLPPPVPPEPKKEQYIQLIKKLKSGLTKIFDNLELLVEKIPEKYL